MPQTDLFGRSFAEVARDKMRADFVVPPFSVLNARDGEWQGRKRAWLRRVGEGNVRSEEGRDGALLGDGGFKRAAAAKQRYDKAEHNAALLSRYGLKTENAENAVGVYTSATSVFDPVLCECVYKWFLPRPGASILDPFAGGSVRGLVASFCGYQYTGIELRPEQVAANRAQAAAQPVALDPAPQWIEGDSAHLDELLPAGEQYDLVFTCPPYYDLEVYSGDQRDGSNLGTYREFMRWYYDIFRQAVARLRPNRFAVVVVGEIRDKRTGFYRNFVGDNITTFLHLGLAYYNEIVLVTPAGTLPLRAGGLFNAGRKVGKTHQNVLVFFKGADPNGTVKAEFAPVDGALPVEV